MSRLALLLLAAVAVLRGASYLPTAWALDELAPLAVVAAQVAAAAAAALLLLALRPHARAEARALVLGRPGAVLLLGATQTAAPLLLVAVALERVPTGLTAVLIAATPLFVALLGVLAGGGRPRPLPLLGLAVGIVGVALVAGLGSGGLRIDAVGGLAALGAALAYAAGALVVRGSFAGVSASATGALAVLGALPFALPPLLLALPAAAPGARALGAVALLGVAALTLAVVLFVRLVQLAGPQRALLVTYLNPAVALLLGSVVEGERITPRALGGLALILAGVALGSRAPAAAPSAAAAALARPVRGAGSGPESTAPTAPPVM